MARRRQRTMKRRRGRGVLGKLRRHKKKVIAAIALPAAAYAAYRNPVNVSIATSAMRSAAREAGRRATSLGSAARIRGRFP